MLDRHDFEPIKAYKPSSMEIVGFSSIVGHDFAKDHLISLINNNRISHSYIFEGSAGVGKFTVAGMFSRMLLCGNGGCGKCASCHKFDTLNHPDYMVIEPEGTGKSILVNQIAKLQEFIMLKPNEKGRKIAVIRNADSMNVAAQNKLLKLLEEPPNYVVIIFTVSNSYAMLTTVVSRSQILSFNKLSNDEIIRIAGRLKSIDPEVVRGFVSFAQGSAGEMVRLLDSEAYNSMRSSAMELPYVIGTGDFLKASELISKFSSGRQEAENFLKLLLIVYRDILAVNSGRKMEETVFNMDSKNKLIDYSVRISPNKSIESIYKIEEALNYLNSNVGIPLIFDNLVIKLREVNNG